MALAPLLVAIDRRVGRDAFRLAFLTGFVSSIGLLYWTAAVVEQFGGLSRLGALAAMVLLCCAVALLHGVFGALVGLWRRELGRSALLLAPLAWVAIELLRVRSYFRFPWCLLGYSQHDALPFLQVAALGGVYAVSALVAVPSAVIAWVAGESTRRRRVALAQLGVGLVAVFVWGSARLAGGYERSEAMPVALVQPSIPQDQKWDPQRLVEHFEQHERLTREHGRGARLVVWPESAVPWLWDDSPFVADRLRALTRDGDRHLLFGNDDQEGVGPAARVFVGAKLLAPSGELSLRHHKMRLVPFGEYVPLAPLFTLGGRFAGRVVDSVGTFSPGSELRLGKADGISLVALICYEAIFPELTREAAARGAGLLVNVTNDAWYGRSSAPWQHFAMARVRAVETGRTLVRAANTGVSAIVDPQGRVLARSELFVEGVVVGEAPIATGRNPYVRFGDAFAWICAALTLGLTLDCWRRRRGSGKARVYTDRKGGPRGRPRA